MKRKKLHLKHLHFARCTFLPNTEPNSLIKEKVVRGKTEGNKKNKLLAIKNLQDLKQFCEQKAIYKDFYQKISMKFWKESKQQNDRYKLLMENAFKRIKSQIVLQKDFRKMERVILREFNL